MVKKSTSFILFFMFCLAVLLLSIVLFFETHIGIGMPENIEHFLKAVLSVSFFSLFPIAPIVAYIDAIYHAD